MPEREVSATDKAGVSYWNSWWAEDHAGQEFAPDEPSLVRYPDRRLLDLLSSAFEGLVPATTSQVAEIGCADSVILPYVGRRFGFRVVGIDYSPYGCERARARLVAAGVDPEVECTDVFSPPDRLTDRFDAAFSIGLVEHFHDSAAIVRALARLLRPGGRLLTVIPNMNGSVGFVQRLIAPTVYGVHVPLDVEELCQAHRNAGLEVLASGWHMPIGFGVVNFHEPGATGFSLLVRRGIVGALSRMSRVGWLWEEKIGRLPGSRLLSPYAYCIARRRG